MIFILNTSPFLRVNRRYSEGNRQSRTTFLAVKSLDLYVGEFDDYFLYWSLIGQNMYIQMLYLSRALSSPTHFVVVLSRVATW